MEHEIARAVQDLLQPHIATFHDMKVRIFDNEVLLKGQVGAEDLGLTMMLRVVVNHEHEQILIPNILMPPSMKHLGLGKQLIARILGVAKAHAFRLFVVDLVPGFHRRLVARGAIPVDDEIVLITTDTDLSHTFA